MSAYQTIRNDIDTLLSGLAGISQHYTTQVKELPHIDISTRDDIYTVDNPASGCVLTVTDVQLTIAAETIDDLDNLVADVIRALPAFLSKKMQLRLASSQYVDDDDGEKDFFERALIYEAEYNLSVTTGDIA